MQTKYILFFIAVLLGVHLFFYNLTENSAVKKLELRTRQFESQVDRLKIKKKKVDKKLASIVVVVNSLKPWLNTGFKDPEKGLVKFLDFLKPSLLSDVNANIKIIGDTRFYKTPVPLNKTNFQLQFEFLHPHEAELFLKELFMQHDYPLKVRAADVERRAGEKTEVNLNIDLLLPSGLMDFDLNDLKSMGV